MEIIKIKETYILKEEETGSKVELTVNLTAENFEILRIRVKAGSMIVERAESLAVETLQKRKK